VSLHLVIEDSTEFIGEQLMAALTTAVAS